MIATGVRTCVERTTTASANHYTSLAKATSLTERLYLVNPQVLTIQMDPAIWYQQIGSCYVETAKKNKIRKTQLCESQS